MRPTLLPLLFAAIASVSGCGFVYYIEPTTGPVSRVRFISHAGNVTVLRQYDDSDCRTGEREVARFGTSPLDNHKSLGMPIDSDLRNGQKTEIQVSSGQTFYGMFSGSTLDASCRIAFGFQPQEARDYEVVYRWDYRYPTCTVKLLVIGQGTIESDISLPSEQCRDARARTHLY